MRIAQLHLAAFGAFTGGRLDFEAGADALHIVCGPNEAGKSTTLRALSGFLFGIPARSDDDFLHSYDAMRVGATLVMGDGSRLSAMRRKGNRNTLIGLDPVTGAEQADRVVAEESLRRALGGLDEGLYRQMFSLDLESLEDGSSALLRGEGELGQSLFQAAAGVAELQDLLRRLDEEAEALFSPRAQKPPLNAALRAYADQRSALRTTGVRPDAWELAERRLREADDALATARARLVQTRSNLAAAQALARNLPLLAEHREKTARLEALGAVPVLAADAAERRIEAQALAQAAAGTVEAARTRLDGIADELERLQRSPAMLEHGQAIEAAFHRTAQWLDARERLPLLSARSASVQATVRALIEGIAGDTAFAAADGEAVPNLARARGRLPSATLRARVDGLIEERTKLDARVEQAHARAGDIDEEIAQARAVLERQTPSIDPVTLREALVSLEGLADAEQRLERGEREHALGTAELDRAAAALAGVGIDGLAALRVPLAAQVDEHRAALEALDVQERDLLRACDGLRGDLTARHAELRVLQATGELVRRADVVEARARRDDGWRRIERVLSAGGGAGEAAETSGAAQAPAPQAYAAAVREADRLADLLHADAQRATLSEELSVRISDMEAALARHEAQIVALRGERSARMDDWSATAAPLCSPGITPAGARAWLEERARLVERGDALRRDAAGFSALRVQLERADAALAAALADAGLTGRGAAEPRAAAVARLRDAVDAAADARAVAADARERIERHERTRERLRAGLASLAGERADWEARWSEGMSALHLPARASVHEARARLGEFDRLERGTADLERVEAETSEAQRVVDGFESGVRALVSALGLAGEGRDAGALAGRLYEALQLVRAAEARHGELQAERVRLTQALDNGLAQQRAAAQTLRALLDAGGCQAPEALLAVEAANDERRGLQVRIAAIEDDLVRLNARPFGQVRADADGRDPVAVADEIAALELVLPELERDVEGSLAAQIAARGEFDAIDGGDAAAAAAQALQQTSAQIVEDARRYARARLARTVLGDVIQHFREQHQGPILSRASALFARMTDGAFAGLSAEFGDSGQVIVGVRGGGARVPVPGMSRGTVDQLYLALRLAAIADAVRAQEPLPLLIDDLLVHFDDRRSAATLQVLADTARDTQVVFFTHHEHLAALAAQVLAPGRFVLHRLPPAAHASGSAS